MAYRSVRLFLVILCLSSCFGPESNDTILKPQVDNDLVKLYTEAYSQYAASSNQTDADPYFNEVVLPFMDEYWHLMDSPNLVKAYFDRKPRSMGALRSVLDSVNCNERWLEETIAELLNDYRQILEVNAKFEVVILPSHHPGNGLVGNTSVIVDKHNYIIVFLDATSTEWRTEMLRNIAYQLVRGFVLKQAGGDLHIFRLADLIILEGKSHFIANSLVPEAIPPATLYNANYFKDGFYSNQIKADLSSTLANVISARFDRDRNRASWFGLHLVNEHASKHPELGLRTIADTSPDTIIREHYASLE